MLIVELARVPRLVVHHKLHPVTARRTSGFVDDQNAIVPSGDAFRWWNPPVFVTPFMVVTGVPLALAVGDRIVVAAEHTGLELATTDGQTRHLGYKLLAQEVAEEVDGVTLVRVSTSEDDAFLRVDDKLRDQGLAHDPLHPIFRPRRHEVLALDDTLPRLALSRDARWIASFDNTHVVVTDKSGALRWSTRLDEPRSVQFTRDGQHLLVTLAGGIVALDAATGHPTARTCAWQFGLFYTPISSGTLAAVPNVCE